jgi:YtxH-like protein
MKKRNVTGLLKTLLQAGLYLVDQPESVARDVRDRVQSGFSSAGDRLNDVSDSLSDMRDRITGRDNTLRYVLSFAAGVGLGVGVGILMAPDSGEETRRTVARKFNDVSDRVKRHGSDALDFQTGT